MGYRPQIKSYSCPLLCGWKRDFHEDPLWQALIIAHPIYGPLKEIDVVARDIKAHNCYSYTLAVARLREAQKGSQ